MKTGTSFLQSAFACNAKNYENYDLIYLDLEKNFDDAIIGNTTSGNFMRIVSAFNPSIVKHYDPINLNKFFADLDRSKNYLFSSEWISTSPEFFKKIPFFLNEIFNYKYIAFIRNPADFIKSSYLQSLKHHEKRELEDKVKEFIIIYRNMCNNLLNVKESLFLENYDIHKDNLLSVVDKLIFGKKVSVQPPEKIVNPSPNYHQANIIRLVNNLGLGNFLEAMKYVEKNRQTIGQNKFKMKKFLYDVIYNDLSFEINEINKLLPEKEKITLDYDDCNETSSQSLFSNNDICFIRKCIDNAKIVSEEELKFIRQAIKKPVTSSEIPLNFDPLGYLLLNYDVLMARIDPVEHYLKYGKKENRKYE